MNSIAFLGTGEMGTRMARNLLKAGHRVIVYNRTPERMAPLVEAGAIAAGSPREAAAQGEIVISMVTDVEASRALWLDDADGALRALQRGTVAIESSTVTPEWQRELAAKVEERGADFLDAPVSGSLPQAEAGELIFLVGGNRDVADKVTATLRTMGSAVHHFGPVGAGTGMKLAVNALLGIEAAALGEVLGIIRRFGLEEEKAIAMLNGSPLMSPRMTFMAGQMAAGSYTPNFPIHLVAKDFRYIAQAAAEAGAATPLAGIVGELFAQAQEKSLGAQDISGIAQMFE